MASAAVLLLLLVSSFVFVSTNKEQEEEEYNKVKEGLKTTGKKILKVVDDFRSVLVPLLSLIPVHGPLISASVNFGLMPLSLANKYINPENEDLKNLKSEFEALSFKMGDHHVQQTWDTWASGAYYKPEKDIEVAWMSYLTQDRSRKEAETDEEKQRHLDLFLEEYSAYEAATKTLFTLLTPRDTTFINSLGQMLATHVNCHEKELRQYNLFIGKLVCKANIMNMFYYKHKNINSDARVDEGARIAYGCASAMFQTHRYCLSNSLDYAAGDVRRLIDQKTQRQALAQKVREFLDETYESFDWMVVAFLSKSSQRTVQSWNSHFLSGFTEVTSGEVSVAVARQVKGKHERAGEVRSAIETCVQPDVKCHDVVQTLTDCQKKVEGVPVSETYTAIHAFKKKSHDSYSAQGAANKASQEAEDEVVYDNKEYLDKTSFIYTGTCKKTIGQGRFIVLIKSDEEMMKVDPCSDMQCGQDQGRGSCVRLDNNILLGACECNLHFYGQNCEQSLEDYKKQLRMETTGSSKPGPGGGVSVVDNRTDRTAS